MNKNAERVVRRAAFELQNTNDIVKLAGIAGTVYDYIAGLLGGGKVEQARKQVQQRGNKLLTSLENTQDVLGRYLEAIRAVDTENIGELKEQARMAVASLGRELGSFNRGVEVFDDRIPLGVMNDEGKVTSEKDVEQVLRHPSTDPKLYNDLVSALPKKLRESLGAAQGFAPEEAEEQGRPMRGIRVPFSQFEWMKQFGPQHVSISPAVKANILNEIRDVLGSSKIREKGHGPVQYKNQLKRLVDDQAEEILLAFRRGLLSNGYLIDYYWPALGSSKKIKRQPANQMMMTAHLGKLALRDPQSGEVFYVEFPTVLVRDMMASLAPSKKLSVRGVKNVRLVSAPEQQFIEPVTPMGGLQEELEESERKFEAEPEPEAPKEEPAPEEEAPPEEPAEEYVPAENLDVATMAYKDVERQSPGYWSQLRPQIEQLAQGVEGVEIPPAMVGWAPQDYRAFIESMDAMTPEEEPPVEAEPETKQSRRRFELLSLAAQDFLRNRHVWARDILKQAFAQMWPDAPLSAIQAAQAVAILESSYGLGWKGAGKGSNNWGAVQSNPPKHSGGLKPIFWQDEHPDTSVFSCPAGTFLRTDSHPSGRRYWVCFRKYESPLAGAKNLIANIFFSNRKAQGQTHTRGELLRNWARRNGSLYEFSAIMRETYYYGGRGNKEQAIRGHAAGMNSRVNQIARALNESPAAPPGTPEPVQNIMARYSGQPVPQQPQLIQQPQPMQQPQQMAAVDPEQKAAFEDAEDFIAGAYRSYVSAAGPLEKMIITAIEKDKLPTTSTLISFDPEAPLYLRVRLAHILSSALDEEVGADTSIHHGEDHVQIECDVRGSEEAVVRAVTGISEGVSEAFQMATGTYVKTAVCADCRSAFGVLEADVSDECFRKFALYMMGRKNA